MNYRGMILNRSLISGSIGMLALGWLSISSVLADSIVLQSGKTISDVQITDARWGKVTYKKDKQSRSVAGDNVLSIDRSSTTLGRARRLLDSGDHDAAHKQFRAVAGATSGWEQAEAMYFMGVAYRSKGSLKKAIGEYKAYYEKFEGDKDWWVPHARFAEAQCHMESGSGSTASKIFASLEKFGPNWTLKAKIGQGRALLVAKKYAEARKVFSSVTANRRAPLGLRHDASVGRAEAMIGRKQYSVAVEELDKYFFKGVKAGEIVYSQARARATLLMGIAYQAQGGKDNLQWAEIWFLKVTGLFSAFPNEQLEAARNLASVYKALGDSKRADEWRKRASARGGSKS